jgi:DNA-binding GntR family transcriptional regulator
LRLSYRFTFNNSNKIIEIKFHTLKVQMAAMFALIMTRNQAQRDFLLLGASTVLAMTLAASQPTFRDLIKTLGRLLWTSDRPVAKASTYTTNIRALSGIQTHHLTVQAIKAYASYRAATGAGYRQTDRL